MERTIIAYILMALLVAAGIWFGLHLRHNSHQLTMRRRAAREKFKRQQRADADNR